jgi:hypothetical protein
MHRVIGRPSIWRASLEEQVKDIEIMALPIPMVTGIGSRKQPYAEYAVLDSYINGKTPDSLGAVANIKEENFIFLAGTSEPHGYGYYWRNSKRKDLPSSIPCEPRSISLASMPRWRAVRLEAEANFIYIKTY